MRKKIGVLCLMLGAVLLLSAAGLVLYNRAEDSLAGEAAQTVLDTLQEELSDGVQPEFKVEYTDPAEETAETMATMEIDGYSYIGYLSIPALELELPVMEDWDYTRMKTAPCRYSGSYLEGDLVIAAHNYQRHFGGIKSLQPGDAVCFTDVEGNEYNYSVASVEVLEPYDVPEMTESEFDLTLFTCTYGGESRVTVRCVKI